MLLDCSLNFSHSTFVTTLYMYVFYVHSPVCVIKFYAPSTICEHGSRQKTLHGRLASLHSDHSNSFRVTGRKGHPWG